MTNSTVGSTRYANVSHDYATADENVTVTIPTTIRNGTIQIQYDASPDATGAYNCAGSLRIDVYAPNGTRTNSTLGGAVVHGTAGSHCAIVTAAPATGATAGDLVAGDWHVQFTGPGTGIGRVSFAYTV